MLIDAARKTEAAAKQMLACVNEGSASIEELHTMLRMSKSISAVVMAAQTSAARTIAGRQSHGDGGTEVLATNVGIPRREADSHVKTAKAIEAVPAVRDAVESGKVSVANAKRLAEAVDKTSAADVEADTELLSKAETMRPEDFAKEARRWAIDRQGDGGESEHARQRSRRCLRMWDAPDGMVHLHGEFDTVTGRRIGNRLQAEARRMYHADKKDAASNRGDERRSFQQCMADALDNLTANNGEPGTKPVADIAVVWHANASTEQALAEIAGGERLPAAVLEELMCNAAITGLIYDTEGVPLWRGQTRRRATEAQIKALIARYGGCFHCGAHPAMCQAHHIKPWSQGGSTDITNMVLACWNCHQRIHHHGWRITTRDGKRVLEPPERTHYGPARGPDPPNHHRPPRPASPPPPPAVQPPGALQEPRPRGHSHTIEPTLFTPA